MKPDKILINFQIPVQMKNRFDAVCEMTGKSKTSVLNSLVEEYIFDQLKDEEQKMNKLLAIDTGIQKRKLMRFRDFKTEGF